MFNTLGSIRLLIFFSQQVCIKLIKIKDIYISMFCKHSIHKSILGKNRYHIKMISEVSRDTKDWSNDITKINYVLIYIGIETSYFKAF